MRLIFICSPFAGDTEGNVKKARHYCRFAMAQGHLPFAPHLLFPQFLNDAVPAERQTGINMGLSILGYCHELWHFGPDISPGMAIEIDWAERLKLPIRQFDHNCHEIEFVEHIMKPNFDKPVTIQAFVKKCTTDGLYITMKTVRSLLMETGYSKGTEGFNYLDFHPTELALYMGMAIKNPHPKFPYLKYLLSANGAAYLYDLLVKRRQKKEAPPCTNP